MNYAPRSPVLQTELETAVRPTRGRADLVDSINHARHEVTRLTTLAEDLLLLAQADGGQPIVRRQLTDVSELLDDVTRSYHKHAEQRSIILRIESPPALIADVDPVALRRILDNLITNALRHTPAGGTVTLDATTDPAASPGADHTVLVLRISDSGTGFPPQFLPHAFDRFGRADQGRSRSGAGGSGSGSGLGLGLAIVHTLVHAHDGTVTARNQPGGGAVLEIRLPVDPEDADTASRP